MNDAPPETPDPETPDPDARDPAAERARRRAMRRAARRATRGQEIDTSIPSPCISVCQIENESGECLGCRRTIEEIRDWIIMTAAEKTAVLAKIPERKARAAASSDDR